MNVKTAVAVGIISGIMIGIFLSSMLNLRLQLGLLPTVTMIEITPANIVNMTIETEFIVNASVDIGNNQLAMWVLSLRWNPVVLQLIAEPIEGPFVKSQVKGMTIFLYEKIEYNIGYIKGLCCAVLSPSTYGTATGSGVIATFKFRTKIAGSSMLDLYGPDDTMLKPIWRDGQYSVDYEFDTVVDGTISVVPEFLELIIIPLFFATTLIVVSITKLKKAKQLGPVRRR